MVYRACDEVDIDVSVTEINKDDKRYPITNFPGFLINEKIISEGKVLTSREIKKLLLSS